MKPAHPILSLSDAQLKRVTEAARQLDIDKRGVLLTRLGENLRRAPEDMTASEFEWLLATSLRGLVQAERRQGAGDPLDAA
jgi:hypothetical protein